MCVCGRMIVDWTWEVGVATLAVFVVYITLPDAWAMAMGGSVHPDGRGEIRQKTSRSGTNCVTMAAAS